MSSGRGWGSSIGNNNQSGWYSSGNDNASGYTSTGGNNSSGYSSSCNNNSGFTSSGSNNHSGLTSTGGSNNNGWTSSSGNSGARRVYGNAVPSTQTFFGSSFNQHLDERRQQCDEYHHIKQGCCPII